MSHVAYMSRCCCWYDITLQNLNGDTYATSKNSQKFVALDVALSCSVNVFVTLSRGSIHSFIHHSSSFNVLFFSISLEVGRSMSLNKGYSKYTSLLALFLCKFRLIVIFWPMFYIPVASQNGQQSFLTIYICMHVHILVHLPTQINIRTHIHT